MNRYLSGLIVDDALALNKMAFISGPRQVGKTTLAKAFLRQPQNYYSWDDQDFRIAWSRSPKGALETRGPGPVVIDELHKDRRWKNRLKGVFDLEVCSAGIIVTGSARLDLFRRGGDSLMGRYLPYRLHPFSVGENPSAKDPDAISSPHDIRFPPEDLMQLSGFPEPLLSGRPTHTKRWSRLRTERLLAEDVRDLRAVSDLAAMRVLFDLLPYRVGSLLSINTLQKDVGAAYATVRDWVSVFASLYQCFLVRPYSKRITRSLKAAPKLYLYDATRIPESNRGARVENLVALHLIKACHCWTDAAHGEFELYYLRDKEHREVDFLVTRDRKPWLLVECKSNNVTPSKHLSHFAAQLGNPPHQVQLVTRSGFERQFADSGQLVISWDRWLARLP